MTIKKGTVLYTFIVLAYYVYYQMSHGIMDAHEAGGFIVGACLFPYFLYIYNAIAEDW